MCIGPDRLVAEPIRNPGRDSSLGCYIASGMFVSVRATQYPSPLT